MEPGEADARPRRAGLRALLVPAILTLVALAILVSLGNWQIRRLAWKEDLIARATERPQGPVRELPPASEWQGIDPAALEFFAFRMRGAFLNEAEARVFTSLGAPSGPYGGPGYWIVTPFRLEGGGTVLVNRGFAPQDRHLPPARGEALPEGPRTITGLLRPDEEPHLFTPDDRPADNLFFTRNVGAIAAAKGLGGPVAPFTIDLVAAETPPGGLPQAGETLIRFPNSHLGYAVTWYGLALALLAVFLAFARGRLRQGRALTRPHPHP